MPDDSPTPPANLSPELVSVLQDASVSELESVAPYAEALAAHKATLDATESTARSTDADDPDRPDDIPTKATTTIKEINNNSYYYWQWREGDSVKSAYKGPVDADQ